MNPTNPYDTIQQLRQQLDTQAVVIEFQKKALKTCEEVIDIVWVSHHANRCDDALEYAREALAIPADSTQILDEVRRAERERVISAIENAWFSNQCNPEFVDLKEAIRAME